MFAENRKISLRQLQVLLLLDCFGTAVLFLPSELAQIGGRSCWIAALVGGVVFAAFSLLLTSVGRKMPEGTAVEWCRFCFGELFGAVILIGLAVNLLICGLAELRLFSEIVCRAMLPNSPVWAISLVILLVAGALAAQGMECRGRVAEILFFVVAIPLVVILVSVAISAEYGRILPLEMPSLKEMGNGIGQMSIIFQGLPFLYFVFPDLQKPAMAKGAVLKSTLTTVVAVTVIVFLCLAVYGEGVLSEKLLPTLQMMERVSFTGIFLTRQDVLLLWFWMASVCIFLSGILFYGSQLGVRMLKQAESKRKTWLWICLAAVFAASFLPDDLSAAYHLRTRILPWFQMVYLVILPIVLLIIAKKKGGRANA